MSADPSRWRGRGLALLVFLFWLAVLLACAPGRDYYVQDTDHGFQLCLGRQVLFGKTPGIDLFSSYGPLIAYTSALGQWVTGSLVGENVLCALGYAAALLAIHVLVARHASLTTGVLASVAGFFLLARFYKWYVWLWPLAALWALERSLPRPNESNVGGSRRTLLLGAILGIGWLYRPDLGTTGLVGTVAVGLWTRVGSAPRDWRGAVRWIRPVVAGFAVPVAAWFLYLFATKGWDGCVYYVRSTFLGALMAKSGMGTRLPRFSIEHPLSSGTVRVVGYALLASTYVACLWSGIRGELSGRDVARSRFLCATAIIGLGVVHQALHRMDVQHLLQVVPPALIGAFVLLDRLVRGFRRQAEVPPARRAWARGAGAVFLAALAWCGVGLARWGRIDLAEPSFALASRWSGLAHPVRGKRPHPFLTSIRRVRELTTLDDSVLVFPLGPQLYVFLERRMSGKLHGYYPGVFASAPWCDDNMRAIEADPPRVILVPPNFREPELDLSRKLDRYRAGHRYLEDFLRERYTEVLYADRFTLVLGRP